MFRKKPPKQEVIEPTVTLASSLTREMIRQDVIFDNTINEVTKLFSEVTQSIPERIADHKEKLLRGIIASISDGAIVYSADGKIRMVNPAFEAIMGFAAVEVSGRQLEEFFPPQELHKFFIHVQSQRMELTTKYNQQRIIEMRNITQPESGFETPFMISLFHDITKDEENTAALQKAAEHKRRLLAALDAADDVGIVITDPKKPDNPIIFVSKGFTKITGYTYDEVLGKNCRFLQEFPADGIAFNDEILDNFDHDHKNINSLRNAIRKHGAIAVKLKNYRKSGATFINSLKISPVHDSKGNIDLYIGVVEDANEEIFFVDQLQKQYSFFEAMLHNVPSAILVTEADGKEIFSNSHWSTLKTQLTISQSYDFFMSFINEFQDVWHGKTMSVVRRVESKMYNVEISPLVVLHYKQMRMIKLTDVTMVEEQKHEVQEKEQLIFALAEALPIPIYFADENDKVIFTNQAYASYFDIDVDDLLGHTIQELQDQFSDNRRDLLSPNEMRVTKSHVKSHEYEVRLPSTINNSGVKVPRDLSIMVKSIDYAGGRAKGTFGVVLEQTNKRRRKRLTKALCLALDMMPEGIVLFEANDDDLIVLHANRAFKNYYSISVPLANSRLVELSEFSIFDKERYKDLIEDNFMTPVTTIVKDVTISMTSFYKDDIPLFIETHIFPV